MKILAIDDSEFTLDLIQDTLDIHRLEMGRLAFDMKEAPVEGIVAESVRNFAPAAKKKNIAIAYHVEPGVNITCDRNRIIQTLGNLISNSIKFSVEDGGRIDITVKRDGDSVTFAVKDNGTGVPKENQQYLFRKFYQADTSLARKANGSGLGLAISKGIVGAHNGRMWMESEGTRGKGSTFYFSIPARQEKAADYGLPDNPALASGKNQSMASQS
jgi:signal transduction histidine kinase